MPCPYFIPLEIFREAGFPHPSRLPLGGGFRGACGAPGHEGESPTDAELKEGCNLGYARTCSRLPRQREADAVRFSILRDRDGQISLGYVSELNYLPQDWGNLHYEVLSQRWLQVHANERVQKLAECYLRSYLARRAE